MKDDRIYKTNSAQAKLVFQSRLLQLTELMQTDAMGVRPDLKHQYDSHFLSEVCY